MITAYSGKPGKPGKPQNAAVLCRISNDAAGDSHGVNDQRTYLVEWGENTLGWGIRYIITENDTSASRRTRKLSDPDNPDGYVLRTNRPDFLRLLRMIRSGEIDGLIVRDVDRTIRDGRDIEDLIDAVMARRPHLPVEAYRGDLRIGTAGQNMMTRMFAALAKGEADKTSERMTQAKRLRAAEGKYRGGPRPYGFEKDGITIRDGEAAAIRWAALELIGGASLAEIARQMTARGMPMRNGWNKEGSEWKVVGLRQILMRARNAGLVTHATKRMVQGREVAEAEVVGQFQFLGADGEKRDPILSEDEWRQVCATLNNEDRRTSPGPKLKYLGTNVYLCGVCQDEDEAEGFVVGQTSRANQKGRYHCKRKLHLSKEMDPVDDIVVAEVIRVLADPSSAGLLRKREDGGPDNIALSAEAAIIRRKLLELESEFTGNQAFSMGAYMRMSGALQGQLDEKMAQMEVHSDDDSLAGIVGRPDAAEIWNDPAFPVERKRKIIRRICRVVLYRQARIRNQTVPFDPDSVEIIWLTPESDDTAPRRKPERAGVRGDTSQPRNRLDYPRTCAECGKAFKGDKVQKFCSYDCYWDSQAGKPSTRATTEKTCEWCGEPFKSYHAKFQRFCSEPCRRRKPARKAQATVQK